MQDNIANKEQAMSLVDNAVIEAGRCLTREDVTRIACGVFKAMKVAVSDEELEKSVERAMQFVVNGAIRRAA